MFVLANVLLQRGLTRDSGPTTRQSFVGGSWRRRIHDLGRIPRLINTSSREQKWNRPKSAIRPVFVLAVFQTLIRTLILGFRGVSLRRRPW